MMTQSAAAREQREPEANSAQASVVNFKAPPDWRRQALAPMRMASFTVQGGDGAKVDVSVSSFQGESGGLLANINRWREQLGLEGVRPEHLESIIERRTLGGRDFVIVDLLNDKSESKNKQRIIGAIFAATDQTWFFKMIGDEGLAAAQKPAFLGVLESVEFGSE
jgi:hypothetical protein